MSEDIKYTYNNFVDQIILAIEAGDEDDEMKWRADFKSHFRRTDEQINAALFKQFSKSKITKKTPDNPWVDLSKVEPLTYQMDGWLLKGDVSLIYGRSGAGKTTFALWQAYNFAKGMNILDRDKPCTPGKSLIIATDSGAAALKKAMDEKEEAEISKKAATQNHNKTTISPGFAPPSTVTPISVSPDACSWASASDTRSRPKSTMRNVTRALPSTISTISSGGPSATMTYTSLSTNSPSPSAFPIIFCITS